MSSFRVLHARKCFGILQLCICLAVLYKIICLQFFTCILLSVLFMYSWVYLSQSFVMFLLLKTMRVHAPETPSAYSLHQRWLKLYLTREWKKRVRWIRHLRKALTNPWFRKQGANLANVILCYQKILCPKNSVIKFMHIYTDDQGTWLLFAFYF